MRTTILSGLIFICISLNIDFLNAQSKSHFRVIPLDSLPNIVITKLIYYQEPLYFKMGEITNKSYLPNWYNAELAFRSISKMDDDDRIKYFHSSLHVNKIDLMKIKSDTSNTNGAQREFKKWPNKIYFGEVWLKIKKTNQDIVLVLNIVKNNINDSLKLNKPNRINVKHSTKQDTYLKPFVFISENEILKIADQYQIISQFTNNNYEVGNFSLEGFQDLLDRSNSYIRSTTYNGMRIFETIEKTSTGEKITSTSNKP